MPALVFPGQVILVGSTDADAVTAIQQRLVAVGCGPVDAAGTFGAETFAAVEHFQARSVDSKGNPLVVDGKVGPGTWAVLFGDETIPQVTAAGSPVLSAVLTVAAGEVGTLEVPPGSNRGPKVDQYVASVGLNPAGGFPWCASFVYFCFAQAAGQLNVENPCVKTGGVRDHWARAATAAGATRILPAQAQQQTSLIVPGMLFLIGETGGNGHMGIIESVQGNQLTTIEGNTNEGGSREGIGVFRRTSRIISQISLGFILYS